MQKPITLQLAIHWIVIYPVDIIVHLSNYLGLVHSTIELLNNWTLGDRELCQLANLLSRLQVLVFRVSGQSLHSM